MNRLITLDFFKFLALGFLVLFVQSCAGYRFARDDNPFAEYGVNSVSIPMFINTSSLPNIATPMTKEIVAIMSSYPGLRVYAGEKLTADAILIGIIRSKDQRKETMKTVTKKFTEGSLEDSIGDRNQFYVPVVTQYKASLHLVLIKNPTRQEIALLTSKLGPRLRGNPKIIFNDVLDITSAFYRNTHETITSDSEGIVNYTKTKHSYEQSLSAVAKNIATTYKGTVLDAF